VYGSLWKGVPVVFDGVEVGDIDVDVADVVVVSVVEPVEEGDDDVALVMMVVMREVIVSDTLVDVVASLVVDMVAKAVDDDEGGAELLDSELDILTKIRLADILVSEITVVVL
jgi:hypothetical protein